MGLFEWLAPRELKMADLSASIPLAPQWDNTQAYTSFAAFAAEGYNASTVVNACVREIATSASMPVYRLMRKAPFGGKVEVTDERARVLMHPNSNADQPDYVEMLAVYLMVAGNAYSMRIRNGSGRIVALQLLRPDRLEVELSADGMISRYKYTIDGRQYYIVPSDIEHLKLPNPYDDRYGLSPLQVAAKYVNLDGSVSSFLRAYFANAGVPAGLLKINRRISSQQEADAARNKWRSSFSGPRGWHGIAVLDEDASYQQVASNVKDMDTSAITAVAETRICAVFGVPPILVGLQSGLESSTYSNYEQARSAFWDETVSPLARRIAAHLDRALEISEGMGNVEVDYSGVRAYEEDTDSLSARTVKQYEARVITLNEARGVLGYDPIDGTDAEPSIDLSAVEALGELIRVGFDPASALSALGLPSITHIGLPPVTVQSDTDTQTLSAMTGALKARVQVPSYISANAQRGLVWNAAGLSGDGLTERTVREAREMVTGSVSEDKVRRMSAWFARHLVDLDRPQNSNPDNEDYPGAGAVAWALWGGSPTNPSQAMDWADAKVAALDRENLAQIAQPLRLKAGILASDALKARALPRAIALGRRLIVQREELTDFMEAALQRYFGQLRSRIAGVLGRQMERSAENTKIAPDEITVEMLFPAGSPNELARVMSAEYATIIRTTWDTIASSGVAGAIDFDDALTIVRQITSLAEVSAANIDNVTRSAVSRAIEIGIERGYSVQQVARGVPSEGFPGIRSLVEETYHNRARTIARTEVMRAQNATTIGYYREQGLQYVRAFDPDGDPDDNYVAEDGRTCIQRHEQIYTMDDSIVVTSHPNCRLTWTPISMTQAEEMGLGNTTDTVRVGADGGA